MYARWDRGEWLDPDFKPHATRTDVVLVLCSSLQSTTLRSGWLRSLYSLFGFGKQQEAASILAAVRAAKPVGHTRDRAGTKRWQTRGSIEHEDPAL